LLAIPTATLVEIKSLMSWLVSITKPYPDLCLAVSKNQVKNLMVLPAHSKLWIREKGGCLFICLFVLFFSGARV
jgi:hypothetical protein